MLAWILFLFQAQAQAPEPKRPLELLALVDQSRSLPPEFCADTLLQLSASRRIKETRWKRELIQEAFEVSAHAQLPNRRRGGIHTDTRQSHESWENDLEALTLQSRAVQAMIPLDPIRARGMFEEIVLPQLPNPDCSEALYPDVGAYYETAALVFPQGFTAKELEKEEHVRFAERVIGTMRSPVQVVPATRMLQSLKLSHEQGDALFTRYAVTLDQVNGSDRVFGPTDREPLVTRLLVVRGDGPIGSMAAALRGYLVRHLSGHRCSDRVPKDGKIDPAAEQFNTLVKATRLTDVKPIAAEEVKPAKVAGTYRLDDFWQSPRSKKVLEELQWLNHGNRKLPDNQRFWTLEERSTNEWTARFYDTLKLIEGWKEEEEPSREEYFAMKAHTYFSLAKLAPPGKARDAEMGQYREFLEQTYFLVENRNYWFTDVGFMLAAARITKDAKDREWILGELKRSANPVIALYAKLMRGEPVNQE